jgi:outer membrane protein, heavy metal efflux system
MHMTNKIGVVLFLAAILLLHAGCTPTELLLRRHSVEVDQFPLTLPEPIALMSGHQPGGPATLDELLVLALSYHPELKSAQANIESARGRMIQAGLYPNPAFGPNLSELGDTDNRWGEPGVRLTLTIVTMHKLRLAKAAGAHAVEAADWQALTRWYTVVTRVRGAYFELLTAMREIDTMRKIVKTSEEALQVAQTLEKTGFGARPDVLRASVELEQNRLRQEVSQRRVEAARENLLTMLGRPPLALGPIENQVPELEQPPPDYDWMTMLKSMHESSSELQEARALVAQNNKLVKKAHADAVPNYTVALIPFYEASTHNMRGELIVQVPLPIFDRNQGNIHSAKAELVRSHNDERQVELRLTERLTAAYQRYLVARRQADSYQKNIVSQARESLRLIETGYKSQDRKYDYTAVLQAQQVFFQAQLAQTQALGELWRAVVDLAAILQQDNLHAGCR